MYNLCDQTNCLIYENIESLEENEKDIGDKIHLNPYFDYDSNKLTFGVGEIALKNAECGLEFVDNNDEKILKIRSELPHIVFYLGDFKIPFECIVCKHRKEIDSMKYIMAEKAHKLLLK